MVAYYSLKSGWLYIGKVSSLSIPRWKLSANLISLFSMSHALFLIQSIPAQIYWILSRSNSSKTRLSLLILFSFPFLRIRISSIDFDWSWFCYYWMFLFRCFISNITNIYMTKCLQFDYFLFSFHSVRLICYIWRSLYFEDWLRENMVLFY